MEPRPCPLHLRQKWERWFWPRHKRNPCWCHDADARHSLVGQDLPSYVLLQRCESTSFTCCGFGGKQQIGDKGKTEMGHVVWANQLLSMISGCSYERAGGWFPLPGAIGAHIFMLRNRMKRRKQTRFLRPNFILLPTRFLGPFQVSGNKICGLERVVCWEGRIRKTFRNNGEYSRVLSERSPANIMKSIVSQLLFRVPCFASFASHIFFARVLAEKSMKSGFHVSILYKTPSD